MRGGARVLSVVVAALMLAACAGPAAPAPTPSETGDSVPVSAECRAALAAFPDAEPLTDEHTDAMTRMASDCATVAEFRAAVIENPEAWGFPAPETDVRLDGFLFLTCEDNAEAPLCVDAAARAIKVPLDK